MWQNNCKQTSVKNVLTLKSTPVELIHWFYITLVRYETDHWWTNESLVLVNRFWSPLGSLTSQIKLLYIKWLRAEEWLQCETTFSKIPTSCGNFRLTVRKRLCIVLVYCLEFWKYENKNNSLSHLPVKCVLCIDYSHTVDRYCFIVHNDICTLSFSDKLSLM